MAALVIVVLMFLVSLAIAAAQDRLVESLQLQATSIKRWGGILLIAVGAWILLLGLFASRFAEIFTV